MKSNLILIYSYKQAIRSKSVMHTELLQKGEKNVCDFYIKKLTKTTKRPVRWSGAKSN